MTARRIAPAAALAGLVLAATSAPVLALTYVENLDDNPEIATALRLERLDRRMNHQSARVATLTRDSAAVEAAMEKGEALAARLGDLDRQFLAGAETRTVQAAAAPDGSNRLATRCARARQILAEQVELAQGLSAALRRHLTRMQAVAVGDERAPSAVAALTAELRSKTSALLEAGDGSNGPGPRETAQGLSVAFGAYASLRRMAEEDNEASSALLHLAVRLGGDAEAFKAPFLTYVDEQQVIGKTLQAIRPEFASEAAVHTSIRTRWNKAVFPRDGRDALGMVASATLHATEWRSLAETAQSGVREGMAPFPDALEACGDRQDPARTLVEGSRAAGKSFAEPAGRVVRACADRLSRIAQARRKAEQVTQENRELIADLDRKLADSRQGGRRSDKAAKLREDAEARIAQLQRAIVALDSEARAVEEQKSAVSALVTESSPRFDLDGG